MKKTTKDLLAAVRADERFKDLLEDLESMRPVVPQYDWMKDNTPEMKARSLMMQGFDSAVNFLKPKE